VNGTSVRTRRDLLAAGAFAAAAALLATAAAQEKPPKGPPQLPDLAAPLLVVPDRHASSGGLEFSDLACATLALDDDDWIVQAEMSRPIADGMFTVIEMEWDCDGQRSTNEVETRAAVGSRFRPNAFAPPSGQAPPMELVRASWASPFDERNPNPASAPRLGMTDWGSLAVPAVGGARIEFRVPRKLPDQRGALSATTPPAFRLTATTTCSEHPIAFDYRIADAGREIKVDGDVSEWSGGPYAEDPTGELHHVLSPLDLKAVWCEHGPDVLFVRADFAAPGFGRVPAGDGDVSVEDALFVEVDPAGVAYMDPIVLRIPATSAAGEPTDTRRAARGWSGERDPKAPRARYVCGQRSVEVSIPRKAEQTRLRVSVWTDAVRVDELAESWQKLPR
jgi:hypothetical protein